MTARRPDGLRRWLRQVRAFARRGVREFTRSRSALFWSLAMPAVWFLLFSARGRGAGGGMAMQAVALGTFGAFGVTLGRVGGNLTRDVRSRRYRKLRSLPVAPSADLTGRFLAGFALGAIAFVVVLGVGAAVGARFTLRSPLSPIVAAVSLFLFCLVGMAASVALLQFADRVEELGSLRRAAILVLFFGTGFNGLSTAWMPASVRPIVNVLPNSLATRLLVRHLVAVPPGRFDPPLPSGAAYLALLGAFAVGLLLAAGRVMDHTVYRGEAGE